MTRPVPDIADRFVQGAEGEVLRVYDDKRPAYILKPGDHVLGTLTGGTGHTGPDLVIEMPVTAAMSDAWRRADLLKAAERLESKVAAARIMALTTHQYSAILSFVFNLGTPGATIWALLNSGNLDQVPMQIMRFDKARGEDGQLHDVPGLDHRRMAECSLWKTPDVAATPGVPVTDQAVTIDAPAPAVDPLAAPLAIIAAAPVAAPPSSVTRAADTPPTPMAMKPLAQSKSFVAQVTTCLVGVAGVLAPVVGQINAGAKSISDAIQPYTDGNPHIAQAEQVLMLVLAVTAAAAVFLTVRKTNQMKNG